jgi:hypothetical protein
LEIAVSGVGWAMPTIDATDGKTRGFIFVRIINVYGIT